MKNLIIVLLIYFPLLLFAQPEKDAKRDFVWLTGYSSNTVDSTFGGTRMDFNSNPVDIFHENRPMNFREANASICDEGGNLLFYSNGIYMAKADHTPILNSGGMSPSGINSYHSEYGLPVNQGVLILPLPNSDNLFYILHSALNLNEDQTDIFSGELFYSIVDVEHPIFEGGWLMEKNVSLLTDTLETGNLTSCRHANGRDWWILVNEHNSNRFYRFLLSPEGIQLIGNQEIGEPIESGLGQNIFSPDGSKFVKSNGELVYDHNKRLDIFDFDRCTGLLSNHQNLVFGDTSATSGIAISPNSRYLYATLSFYTFQFDLEAEDILASKDTVAIFDGFEPYPGFLTAFSYPQLAPNGKIYITTNFSLNYLHVIHNPDEPGEDCNFEQHGITLPTINDNSIPHFPNFRLGPLEGSPCDTLSFVSTTIEELSSDEFSIYPNPTNQYLTIKVNNNKQKPIIWHLYNQLGQIVQSANLESNNELTIDLGNLSRGIYFYHFRIENKIVKQGKVILE